MARDAIEWLSEDSNGKEALAAAAPRKELWLQIVLDSNEAPAVLTHGHCSSSGAVGNVRVSLLCSPVADSEPLWTILHDRLGGAVVFSVRLPWRNTAVPPRRIAECRPR